MSGPEGGDGAEARYRAVRDLPLDGAALPSLIGYLSDESWRVRKAAVDRLVELQKPDAAVPLLVAALGKGDDAQARNAAAEALARIGGPAVAALARALRSEDADVRKFAADVLGEVGTAEGVEPLASALDDADRNVRASAAEALGKIGGSRAAVALERALRADDHLLRVCALDGLWRIGATPDTAALARLARDRFLRRPVYRLLGRATDERALELLLEGLADPGRSTREAALAGIAEQARRGSGFFHGRLMLLVRRAGPGALGMVRAAREALGRDDPAAVEGAIWVLGASGAPADAQALAELGSQDRYRDAARSALAALGSAAVEPLRAGLANLGPGALALAGEVLGPAHGEELAKRALDALETAPPEAAPALLELLGRVAPAAAAAGLLGWVEDALLGEGAMRALVAVARREPTTLLGVARARWREAATPALCALLGEVGEPEDVALLLGALRHAEAAVRASAARALGARGERSGTDALRGALVDESEAVRAAAMRALGALRPPDLEALCSSGLHDPATPVAAAAAEVASAAGLKALAPALAGLLARPEGPLALAALEALERLDGLDLPLLEQASEHAHPEVDRAALTAAAGRAGGLELVRRRLGHPRWEVRRAAARVLGAVADAAELPSLRAALARESDPLVGEALHQAVTAVEARRRV